MEPLVNPAQAENKVLTDITGLLMRFNELSGIPLSIEEGAERLWNIRRATYEDLNQIQHEYLILRGLQWILDKNKSYQQLQWFWNPRQTGASSEPDLQARDGMKVVISAEATTSEKPQGTIDKRMYATLAKLNMMEGSKYYFVLTEAMTNRARSKIKKNSWDMEVVCFGQ